MPKRLVPSRFELDYPLIPLTDSEKKPILEGGGGALSRFLKRIPAVEAADYFKQDYYKLAELLFFKGGRLSPAGLRPREGIDEKIAYEVLCSMLESPFPNHIQKEATAALAIYNWYEEGERDTEAEEPVFPRFFKPGELRGYGRKILVGENKN